MKAQIASSESTSAMRRHSIRSHRRAARPLGRGIASEKAEEMLVVIDLVGADARRELAQHRLGRGVRQHAIEARRAGLDDAARDHLERAGLGEMLDRAERLILAEETAIGALPIELRPRRLDIAAQRVAVLHLLVLPALLQPVDDLGVAAVEFDEVARIRARRDLDERRGRDKLEQPLVIAQ